MEAISDAIYTDVPQEADFDVSHSDVVHEMLEERKQERSQWLVSFKKGSSIVWRYNGGLQADCCSCNS